MKRLSTYNALKKAPWVCIVFEEIGENMFNFILDGAIEKDVVEKAGDNELRVIGKGLKLIKLGISISKMPEPKIIGKNNLKPCVMIKIPLHGLPTYVRMSNEELIYFDKDQRKQIIEMIQKNQRKHNKKNILNWTIVGIVSAYVLISIVTAISFAIIAQSVQVRFDELFKNAGLILP
jgi:hypothetical protein